MMIMMMTMTMMINDQLCFQPYTFPLMRSVQAAVLCSSTTAYSRTTGNRTYTAKVVKERCWLQSKRKPSAKRTLPSADKNICRNAENRGMNRTSEKVV